MDNNAQNLANAQNQPQTPPAGPAPRPPMPTGANPSAPTPSAGPSSSPRPVVPGATPNPTIPNSTARPAMPGATASTAIPGAAPSPTMSSAASNPTALGANPQLASAARPTVPNPAQMGTVPPQPTAPVARPTVPGPAQMGAAPRPATPPTPTTSAMPNFGGGGIRPMVSGMPAGAAASGTASAANAAAFGMTPGAANAAQNQSGAQKANSKKKPLYITLGCVAAAVVVAAIIAVVINVLPGKEPEPTPAPVPEINVVMGETPILDLNKDELLYAFNEMQQTGYVPKGFLSKDVAPYFDGSTLDPEGLIASVGEDSVYAGKGSTLVLADSYADPEELATRNFYGEEYEAAINQVDETFAIITAVDEKGEVVPTERAYIAFDQEYLIYFEADAEAETDNANATEADDRNVAPFAFVDVSEEFLQKALPILELVQNKTPLSGIYSYEITIGSKVATMDVYTIAGTPPVQDTTDGQFVAAYHSQVNVDMQSGETYWTVSKDGEVREVVANYAINDEEAAKFATEEEE